MLIPSISQNYGPKGEGDTVLPSSPLQEVEDGTTHLTNT